MVKQRRLAQSATQQDFFHLTPLSACVRMAIAGSMIVGAPGVYAELPIPRQVLATMGQASVSSDGTTMTVKQDTDKVILNWEQFNIGKENTVHFDQQSSSWIALNRIFQQDPSQILGKITATGQVYLYNKNGFVFGKDSVVDVNTLVATTLNVSDEVFEQGIVTTFDTSENGDAALVKSEETDIASKDVKIQVEAGGQIKVADSGRLILAGQTVENAGTITGGKQAQLILVASKDKVYLQPAESDGPFAGLLVEVGSGGKVTNLGEIATRQGNITLAGFAVNQSGRVTATTSVDVNGSIRLLARQGGYREGDALAAVVTNRPDDGGDGSGYESTVTFGKNSLTKIIADTDGGSAIDEQAQPLSYLEATANTIHMESSSAIVANGGQVNFTASNDLKDTSLATKGRILLDAGASIDVSGTKHISADISRNVQEMSVQSYELRDSPYQKDGVLKGQTVYIDVRADTDIVDTSGAVARFERSIEERLGTGGEINFTASGSVVINSGATVDISGGSIDYQSGYINTTKLITDYGQVVDISDADPNQRYAAIFGVVTETHEKWGVTQVWDNRGMLGKGRFEEGYTQGLDAGNLNISAAKTLFNGELVAGTVASTYQRSSEAVAFGGSLTIDMTPYLTQDEANQAQNVIFQTVADTTVIGIDGHFPSGKTRPNDLILSTGLLNRSGVEKITVKTQGAVTVSGDAKLELPEHGELAIEAGKINVWGDIDSAGGSIDLTSTLDYSAQVPNLAGTINIGEKAELNVSGRWINDFELGLEVDPTEAIAIDGGKITLASESDLTINKGAELKADGGAWLNISQELTAGTGGAISLSADSTGNANLANVVLKGQVSASGLEQGGSLTIASSEIHIGDNDPSVSGLQLAVNNGQFGFNQESGFSEIELTSTLGDLTVSADTELNLVQQNRLLQGDFLQQASARSLEDFSQMKTLPDYLRTGVDLSLTALTDLKLETGSRIQADNNATVALQTSAGGIYVDGAISAPSGSINIAIKADSGLEYDATQAIWLGQHAELSTAGAIVTQPSNGLGFRTGDVLAGGDINLTTERGYIILEQGSKLDVSGTKAEFDLTVADNSINGFHYQATTVGSDAGKIALSASEGAVLDGQLIGQAGTNTNEAGRLDIALDRTLRNVNPDRPLANTDIALSVVQHDKTLLDADAKFGDVIASEHTGNIVLSSEEIAAGGFSDLRLSVRNDPNAISNPSAAANEQVPYSGSVDFVGDVTLSAAKSIDIDSNLITWSADSTKANAANVTLNTAYLKLGSRLDREVNDKRAVETGAGLFTANSTWTELTGASLWNGFSEINLNSSNDLRTTGLLSASGSNDTRDYVGEMVTAANINISASQVYPTTLSKFTFAIENNPNGTITVNNSGHTDSAPLSAAGQLTLSAPNIVQNGVVKAPFGTINLVASNTLTLGANSTTSVSGNGQLIPFGLIQGSLDWIYPLDSTRNLVFSTPPEKQLALSAPSIVIEKGGVVDVSGGGDLYAYEFLPGSGGSYDYLDMNSASYQGGFAVVPSLDSDLAPYDPLQSTGFDYAIGTKVYLSGVGDLPAGEYTILPAHYALLPGAYLVTPQSNSVDQVRTTYSTAGVPVVSGYFLNAGSGSKESRTSGFLVETGSEIRKRSEYDEQKANTFYTNLAAENETVAPILPMDSGQISIAAQEELLLDGEFKVDSSGRGARMDIAANRLKIVNALSATPTQGTLEILADDITQLGVDSLFLGGTRSIDKTTGDTNINVVSNEVVFDTNAKVSVTDLVVAASDKVEVLSGAEIKASGKVNTGDSVFNVTGDSALLRVSADEQVTLNRSADTGASGDLLIRDGALLTAEQSMLLDSSKTTVVAGDIVMDGGALSISANSINIGDVAGLPETALNLSNDKLAKLTVDELALTSREALNFYGDVGLTDANGQLSAISFEQLSLNAAGFVGHGSSEQVVKLAANTLHVENSANAQLAQAGNGQQTLDIAASQYQQGEGDFAITGFDKIKIDVAQGINALGDATVTVSGDTTLSAGYITGTGGKLLTIDASGHALNLLANSTASAPDTLSIGGAVNLIADAIDFNANVLMPSGSLGLTALKDTVHVGESSRINLAGVGVTFADKVAYTPGGSFNATANHGQITLAEGSVVDISSGGGNAAGGLLTLKALQKNVELLGSIKATQGSAEIDVASYSANADFNSLMNTLTTAGISDELYFRVRQDDIEQAAGQLIKANQVTLVSDTGAIKLAGTVNADNSDEAGKIQLYAGDKIVLADGARLTAQGATGGKVLLASVDGDNDNLSGIRLEQGSAINVSGSDAASGGEVTLRALRTNDGINIDTLAGNVTGYAQQAADIKDGKVVTQGYSAFYAEGVKKYDKAAIDALSGSSGEINANVINQIKADTDAYMTTAMMNKVNNALGQGIRLRAGVQIDYAGDLALNSRWDFADAHYNESTDASLRALSGQLIVNSTGNIQFNQSLTDGFKDGTLALTNGSLLVVRDMLQTDDSWSYQVTAGADLTSADANATAALSHLTVGSGVTVRTGTGDIRLNAGGDVVLTDQTSTIYSAGRAESNSRYGALSNDAVGFVLFSEYPVDGGELSINAGRNVVGAVSDQFINSWLLRIGNWTDSTSHSRENPTAWGVALGYIDFGRASDATAHQFQQNIGSFGGGNVDINADGDIQDLTVVMPTTGKQLYQNGLTADDTKPNEVAINGGGAMQINAGGDISGGTYYVGQGEATISAGGDITGSNSSATDKLVFSQGPQLLTGDARFTLNASGDVSLSAVSDAMLLHSGSTNFFSYGADSALTINSLAGDISLGADTSVIGAEIGFSQTDNQGIVSKIYPASLATTAFGGSVYIENDITLYPSASGNLSIFAANNITSTSDTVAFNMSDADASLLPHYQFPVSKASLKDAAERLSPLNLQRLIHATTPVHTGDDEPVRLVTLNGKIGDIDSLGFYLPKKAIVQSGSDIKNTLLTIQHVNEDDVSIISAGRDLVYTSVRSQNGEVTQNVNGINIMGTGDVLIKAGRNIDLGSSNGILTTANAFNSFLSSDKGANATLIAGLNSGDADYSAFVDIVKYADNYPEFKTLVTDFMRTRTGNAELPEADALAAFRVLSADQYVSIQSELNALTKTTYKTQLSQIKALITPFMQQRLGDTTLTDDAALIEFAKLNPQDYLVLQPQLNALVNKVFYNELKLAGTASASDATAGNERGFEAIATLFPGTDWKGDISLFFSQIQTWQGGDINLLAPGGGVNAGLAVSSFLSKDASNLGIVVKASGDINAFVNDDFVVNQSRVFALGGGDILLWSSEGDIDAGRGAKSAISAPAPTVSFDEFGNLVITPSAVVSGSGIRTSATVGNTAGDVFLFAPKGVVNAGEAGIGGNNVTISATAVLGANNIQVGGVSTGVPAASAGSLAAGLGNVSNLSASVNQVAQASADMSKDTDEDNADKSAKLGVLSVDYLGSGSGDADTKKNKPKS